jgi:hypothetical protein
MRHASRLRTTFVGVVLGIALLSLAQAHAQNWDTDKPATDTAANVFAPTVRADRSGMSQREWLDASALSYASAGRLPAAPAPPRAPPLPAVDGINAKIDGFGGGASSTNSFYGTSGSLSLPIGQRYGLQIDSGATSANGTVAWGPAAHLFWRDPAVGLLGAFGSYSHWSSADAANVGAISVNVSRAAAEGEAYWGRWTLRGLAGIETVHVNAPVMPGGPAVSVPDRFFDAVSVSYYVTDNFELSIGHTYQFGQNALTLGSEYGFALGGGRMASLFAEGVMAEGGDNAVLAGVRLYFGQHDKTLIDRQRQDDPESGWHRPGYGGFRGGYRGGGYRSWDRGGCRSESC